MQRFSSKYTCNKSRIKRQWDDMTHCSDLPVFPTNNCPVNFIINRVQLIFQSLVPLNDNQDRIPYRACFAYAHRTTTAIAHHLGTFNLKAFCWEPFSFQSKWMRTDEMETFFNLKQRKVHVSLQCIRSSTGDQNQEHHDEYAWIPSSLFLYSGMSTPRLTTSPLMVI